MSSRVSEIRELKIMVERRFESIEKITMGYPILEPENYALPLEQSREFRR